ncbi:MAG TPA: EAL domain-containing protein [Candidatus Saccharimonadia bacterium]|nr:EAL domain-containing protein [Candidatus Saccharimonadia bacterium]
MKPILLAESSQTRRRALSALLAQRGYAVTALASLDEAYAVLQRAADSANNFNAVVLGWPEYADGTIEDVFGLLHGARHEHLPVLILADSSSPGAVNWRMTRPHTALLLWSDYHEGADALDQMLRPRAAAPAAIENDGGALRVLLVDDSATVRLAFGRLIAKYGYSVETACDAAAGYAKAKAQPFDVAIIDYFMPDARGTELIARLKQDPDTSHILSATITGTYSDAIITESLSAGAVECLFKSEAKELFLARLTSMARTVNDRKAIDAERRRLRGILSSVGDGVYGVDSDGTIAFINPAALDLLGYAAEEDIVGRSAFETFHYAFDDGTAMPRSASFLNQCYANGSQVPAWQTVFWNASKRAVPIECTVYPMKIDGERTGSVVAFRDISARRMLEEELRWAAEHDALTKLHNRAWFELQLEQEVARLKRTEQNSLLLFVDVDRFKYINDTAGHNAGDQLLLEVSQRLKSRLRGSDHLARMGGDEYAVILRNVSVDDVASLADGFRRALTSAPFTYGGKSYRITISVGVARLDAQTASTSEAMAHADIACHIAKNGGRNQTHLYTPETGRKAAMDVDLGWSARLEDALRGDKFVLCFQPIAPLLGVELEPPDNTDHDLWQRQLERNPSAPACYEVLLRLKDSHGELISPHAFLPTAERFGLMVEIDRWVIDRAFRTLRECRGGRPIVLAINLSSQTLEHEKSAGYITSKIVQHDIDPAALVFEIAESRAITEIQNVQRLLHDLRALGCRIAVDDFGTGFSTFAYLKQLDADFLKIDGSLIQGLPDDPLDRAVLAALTSIAEAAGKQTVAECVENPRALMALLECGVDFAQGHAVGLPRAQLTSQRAAAGLEQATIAAVGRA